jgi:hypothetical protein
MRITVSGLPAETSVRLKIFARNSKGKSDYVWLRGQTLRAPDRVIVNRDFLGMNHLPHHQRLYSLFRRPLLIFFLIASAVVVVTVLVLAVIVWRQFRTRHSASVLLTTSSCHFNSGSQTESSSDRGNESDGVLKAGESGSSLQKDDMCDGQLLSQGDQFSGNPYPSSQHYVSNGPPDIIPSSFPFASSSSFSSPEEATTSFALLADDKNFTSTFGT